MFKNISNYYLNLNIKIKKLMKFGFAISLILALVSSLLLYTYNVIYNSPILYYIGLNIFKLGITYFVTFFCFSFAFEKILEDFN